jgi:hypothetical protein
LSTSQAAEALGVSEASIRRWSDRGILPVQRVGRRRERRFMLEHLEPLRQPGSGRPLPPPAKPSAPQVFLGGVAHDLYTHLAVFYDSDAGRLRLSTPFLEEGLRAGQPCSLIAHGSVLEAYLERLRAAPGLDVETALETGLLKVFDAPGANVDAALQFWEQTFWAAVEDRAPVIRAVGEMECVREKFNSEAEMLAFEAAFNLVAKRFPCFVICQYDVRAFTGTALLSALRAHPDLLALPLRTLIA